MNRSVCPSEPKSLKSRAFRSRLPRGACPYSVSPPLCSSAAMMLVSNVLYRWAESKINLTCVPQQRTDAANFLSLGGCASKKSLIAFCPVRLVSSGVVPNTFPQKHTRQLIPLHVQISPCASCVCFPSLSHSDAHCVVLRKFHGGVADAGEEREPRRAQMKRNCRSRPSCSLSLAPVSCDEPWQAAWPVSLR